VGIRAPCTNTGITSVAARQSRGNFETNEIVGLVESTCARWILYGCPSRPNDRQQDRALGYVVVDGLAEIFARTNVGDIHKDRARAQHADQVVIEAPSFTLRVRPSIAYKDCAAHRITAMLLYLKDKSAK
jgi:hypothetical protein